MVATIVLIQDATGNLHDQKGHLRNADDDFLQVVKEEKLQEGDFQVESSMSFSGSHCCRPTPRDEYRPMDRRVSIDVSYSTSINKGRCIMRNSKDSNSRGVRS
ncbi:hypothetical protein DY000_02016651 [Brassica cretica]|uniref:Uncharacterized protein n=1 Tax=Brassica cretica TaxID=69181 RepID=A0ABQ7D0Y8_BRACR|nr:hypothetical protein DY000_02016651 [Brassica cretica]